MKNSWMVLVILIPCLTSCEKQKHNVHFHGRVVANCNPQFPARNERITLHRYYDTGITGSEWLGETTTDANGYYSLTTDVGQRGDFRSYILNMYGSPDINKRHFSAHLQSYNDTKDVEINVEASPNNAFGFHIKNVSPFNGNDVFNALVTEFTYGNVFTHTIAENFTGTNTDTIIYRFYLTNPVKYKFSYTKDGVYHEIPFDTISGITCMDTVIVDIFY